MLQCNIKTVWLILCLLGYVSLTEFMLKWVSDFDADFAWRFCPTFDSFLTFLTYKIFWTTKLTKITKYQATNCLWIFWIVKGCLRYKTITSQDVPSEDRLRIFLFYRKVMFRSRDIQVFVFLTILWFTQSVTSWWVLLHEAGCIFEYIFWTKTH